MAQDILPEENFTKAWETTIRILAARNHTQLEIEQKLKKRGYLTKIILQVIKQCEEYNYINDEATALSYLNELKLRRYGTYRILMTMKQKGLDKELIENLLEENYPEEEEVENAQIALKKIQQKLSRETDIYKKKNKIYRYLSTRGFSSHIIQQVQ
jgi:regulatory protein